jgi:hypothetical protein
VKLFIQVEIGHWQESGYDKPWLHFASSLSSDVMGTDLDNQSEAMVADLVLNLIDRSDLVFLLIQAHQPNLPLGAASKVFHYSLQHQERIGRVVLSGEHEEAEQIAGRFAAKFIKENNEEKIKGLIKEFAQ